MEKQIEQITIVYLVTSFGRVVGAYADSNDAFMAQMQSVNKGRVAELVPMPIVYPLNAKGNG